MDSLTQGLLGAAAAQALMGRRVERAWLVGAVGGLLPDADILIRSASDPLLAIEYHRQFTHALVFIPVGGLIAALPWIVRKRHRRNRKEIVAAAIVAYATHGLLDACTTYGTQLFWPFSSYRVAWNLISIVDPIFTIALIIGLVWSTSGNRRQPAAIALAFCLLYLFAGGIQRERAVAARDRIAATRGQTPVRADAFPTIGNNLVWRSLYQSGDSLYADRIRVPWLGSPEWTEGLSVAALSDPPPSATNNPRIRRDFQRFSWFSAGWLARDPTDSTVIGDARYSMRTEAFEPIWGVRFHPNEPTPTEWVDRTRDRSISLADLWAEITGTDPAYTPVSSDGRKR